MATSAACFEWAPVSKIIHTEGYTVVVSDCGVGVTSHATGETTTTSTSTSGGNPHSAPITAATTYWGSNNTLRLVTLSSKDNCLAVRTLPTLEVVATATTRRAGTEVSVVPPSCVGEGGGEEGVVVVGDKAGDAYVYALPGLVMEEDKGELDREHRLLGHIGMLTCVETLVVGGKDEEEEKERAYVVTADRDERIRVSSFPDAYNIQSFCLGQSEFISALQVVPNTMFLFSGSGDGSVAMYDGKDGSQIGPLVHVATGDVVIPPLVHNADVHAGNRGSFVPVGVIEQTDTSSLSQTVVGRLTLAPDALVLASTALGHPAVYLLSANPASGLSWEGKIDLVGLQMGGPFEPLPADIQVLAVAFDAQSRLWISVHSETSQSIPAMVVLVHDEASSSWVPVAHDSDPVLTSLLGAELAPSESTTSWDLDHLALGVPLAQLTKRSLTMDMSGRKVARSADAIAKAPSSVVGSSLTTKRPRKLND